MIMRRNITGLFWKVRGITHPEDSPIESSPGENPPEEYTPVGRLETGPRLVGRIRSGVRISVSFQFSV